jgi:hypothetical protein
MAACDALKIGIPHLLSSTMATSETTLKDVMLIAGRREQEGRRAGQKSLKAAVVILRRTGSRSPKRPRSAQLIGAAELDPTGGPRSTSQRACQRNSPIYVG